jgi:hypothetical protein
MAPVRSSRRKPEFAAMVKNGLQIGLKSQRAQDARTVSLMQRQRPPVRLAAVNVPYHET